MSNLYLDENCRKMMKLEFFISSVMTVLARDSHLSLSLGIIYDCQKNIQLATDAARQCCSQYTWAYISGLGRQDEVLNMIMML